MNRTDQATHKWIIVVFVQFELPQFQLAWELYGLRASVENDWRSPAVIRWPIKVSNTLSQTPQLGVFASQCWMENVNHKTMQTWFLLNEIQIHLCVPSAKNRTNEAPRKYTIQQYQITKRPLILRVSENLLSKCCCCCRSKRAIQPENLIHLKNMKWSSWGNLWKKLLCHFQFKTNRMKSSLCSALRHPVVQL